MQYSKHRRAIERLYEDRATISRHINIKDPATKETRQTLQTIYEDQRCKLSQTSLPHNGQTEDANNVQYDAVLFIAPELEIHQGDAIAIARTTGRTDMYCAGKPFPPYSSHQEILLTAKDWA